MTVWHLTKDGLPVVPEDRNVIDVWGAWAVPGRDEWVYAATQYYVGAPCWWGFGDGNGDPHRWAYIQPPQPDVLVEELERRYLLKRGWVMLGDGKTEDGADIPAALHQWVDPDYRWLALIVGTDRAAIVQAAREVSRYLEMLYQAGDLDAEGACFVAKPKGDEL